MKPTPSLHADTSRWFYASMAGSCITVAVLGFIPTYFLPLANGANEAPPIIHIHGVIFFAWLAYFCLQTWLVASGNTRGHRSWGLLGIGIVTAMVLVVTAVASLRISQAALPGQPDWVTHGVRSFAWVNFAVLSFFVPAVILAIVNLARPEAHKRLMLMATISLLGAPVARLFLSFLAPPTDAAEIPWPADLPDVRPGQVTMVIAPHLTADLLLLAAVMYDWRTRGRPHRVYIIGGAALLILQTTMVPVSESAVWQAIATALGHLNG